MGNLYRLHCYHYRGIKNWIGYIVNVTGSSNIIDVMSSRTEFPPDGLPERRVGKSVIEEKTATFSRDTSNSSRDTSNSSSRNSQLEQ
jgi:hypothetical protein